MGHNSTPFFFAFHHMPIALDASYLLPSMLQATSSLPSSSTSYSSCPNDAIHTTGILIINVLVASHRIVQPPTVWHLKSYANNLTKHVGLLAASYSRLSLRPASSSPPSSSTSYLSCPTDDINTTGIPIDLVLVTSYCTTSHCLSLGELRKQSHEARLSSRCGLFAIVLAAGIILTAILTDIILVVSYCITSHCLALGELH